MSIEPEVFDIAGTTVVLHGEIGDVIRKAFSNAGAGRSTGRRRNRTNKIKAGLVNRFIRTFAH